MVHKIFRNQDYQIKKEYEFEERGHLYTLGYVCANVNIQYWFTLLEFCTFGDTTKQ